MIIAEYVASFVPDGSGVAHLLRCPSAMKARAEVSMEAIMLLSLSIDFLLYLSSGTFSQSKRCCK